MAVELRHLRYFAAVADARTVSLAATRLYLTQPALSQGLRQLEQDSASSFSLGTPAASS